MSKVFKVYVDNKGRDCDGCTKCCEGWLTTKIYEFEVGPGTACKFMRHRGCSIYDVRPHDPCKTFQCAWKENDALPYNLKPDISKVILLLRYIEDMPFYRIVKCGNELKQEVKDWAQDYSKKGRNVVGYDNEGKLLIFSESRKFREAARKHYNI